MRSRSRRTADMTDVVQPSESTTVPAEGGARRRLRPDVRRPPRGHRHLAACAVRRRRLRPGDRLRHGLRSRRARVQPERSAGLEGAARGRLPGRPLGSLRRHVGAADPRHRQRDRLRHRELHQPRRRRLGRPSRRPGDAGADRWSAADHQRPAVPQHGPTPPAASVRAQADRAVGAGDPPAVPAVARRDRHRRHPRRVGHRRCGAVRAAHPRQRHRPHARLPRRGR